MTTIAPVVWEWEVVPLRHGKKSLVIDVSANLLVGPQKELVQLQTLSEEIQINVGIVRWITSTFFGLPGIALGIAAIFVAGLGALNYLRPGSVARGAAVLVAGDTMPVATGYADSLARPGGNITGFMTAEYSTAGKLLELLKQIAPGVTRVAILRDPGVPAGLGQFSAIQTAAVSLGIEISALNVRDASEIERGIAAFARSPNGGLIVTASSMAQQQRSSIVSFAARHKLPAVYFNRTFISAGGLTSHGVDFIDQYRRAASYVDRILKGEKPGELPIQAPVKYQTVVNMKTAKALGLDVPQSVLARADEVIE